MIYLPGRSAASALVAAALTMRLFWGLTVDFPFAMNASWICPLLGYLIFLPLGFAIHQAEKSGNKSIWGNLSTKLPLWGRKVLEILFALILVYDSIVVVRLLASSSNLIALNDITVHILIFPLAFVIIAIVLLGGDACGNSARIWLKILPLFAVILLAVQVKHFRTGWITPVFGGGINSILNGSIYCAGCLSLASLSWIIAVPDRSKKNIYVYTTVPCIVISALMLTQHMSFPAMINVPFTRAARIELILSNGRMSLSPQLLLDVLWFGGLLQLISAEVVTAAAYLHSCCKKIHRGWIAVFLSACITVMAIFNPEFLLASPQQTQLVFLEIGGLFACLLILNKIREDNKLHVQA